MSLGLQEIIVLAVIGWLVISFIQRRSQRPVSETEPVRSGSGSGGTLLAAFAGFGVIALVFVLLAASFVGVERRTATIDTSPAHTVAELPANFDPSASTIKRGHIETATTGQAASLPVSALEIANLDLPQADRSQTEDELPAWLTEGTISDGTSTTIIVSSQQFATIEEARDDALAHVNSRLASDLARFPPQRFSLRNNQPLNPQAAIRDTYVQTIRRDFGTFFHPMYRVWHRVELSPQVRAAYLASRIEGSSFAHLLVTLTAFAALLIAPLGIVVTGLLTRLTGPGSRPWWIGVIGGMVVGTWIIGAQVLNHFVVLW